MDKYVVTMLGEKDHGKSTLIGNLLIETGAATDVRIKEAEKYSKNGRFEPAYILDSFFEEREQEMTIDTTRAEVTHRNKLYELIDVPGHLELIKNMMSGASNGDLAVLMVSIKEGEGFQPQTKRHLYLSNMFGIRSLVVAVNKMDLAGYDREVFESTKEKVSEYLRAIGFSRPTAFVPISAYDRENITKPSKKMAWYKGKALLDTLDGFAKAVQVGKSAGMRMLVQDSTELDNRDALFGILYAGGMMVGDRVVVEPDGIRASVEKIFVKGKSTKRALEGSNVAVMLNSTEKVDRGSMLCKDDGKRHKAKRLNAHVFMIHDLVPKRIRELTLKMNNHEVIITGVKVREVVSPVSGKTDGTTSISANNAARVEFMLANEYPIERYSEYNELGRFAIYERGEFAGIGIVE